MVSFEAQKQLLGCGDDSCLAELGGALGVEFIVMGSVSKIGESTLISLKKINLETLQVERRVTDTFNGVDDEVVGFARWMTRRLARNDAFAGAKPIARPKAKVVKDNKVHYVEKNMTIWRTLAWGGALVTGTAALVTASALGGTYGTSWYVSRTKTSSAVDRSVIRFGDSYGPYMATVSNVGLYTTGALFALSVVLFFLPAEHLETRSMDLPTAQQGKEAGS